MMIKACSEKLDISLKHILPIAEQMMVRSSLEVVTLPAVAEASGCPIHVLLKFFPTSKDLCGAILLHHATTLLTKIRMALCTIEDSMERLRIGLQCKVVYAIDNPVVIRLFQARSQRFTESYLNCLPSEYGDGRIK